MKEERMLILNMLNEGKITAGEAVDLLNALGAAESRGFDDFARGVKGKAADFAEKAEPKVKKAAKGFKDKSAEVFGSIKEKIMDNKKSQDDGVSEENETDYVEVVFEDDETEE